jgi:Transglycosylase SLT domain
MAVESINVAAASPIAGAIRDAAQTTGTSFEYLLTTAQIESNLNPAAQATTSSAKGLYQFIEQTWLATLKQAGPALGLGDYSAAIMQGADGRYAVPDPAARTAIMRLRSDPSASAMVAGAFTRSNEARLAAALGRGPSQGELYIAHFLGPDGASQLIGAATSQPQSSAAAMFPSAAAANRSIFYDGSGSPRSAAAVYAKLTGRYDVAHALTFTPGASNVASASDGPTPPAPIPAPDTAGVTQAYAQARSFAPAHRSPQDNRPLFQSMFTDVPRQGVSATVNTLWASGKAGPQPDGQPSALLDLFRDPAPVLRKGGKV